MEIIDDGTCFVCGDQNEIGLKLRFQLDRAARKASTTTVLKDHFSGWVNAAHGGIICCLLDEAMGGQPFSSIVEGELLEHRRNIMKTRARVLKGNEVLAESEGMMMVVGEVTDEDDYEFIN